MENQNAAGKKIIITLFVIAALTLIGYGFYRSQKADILRTEYGQTPPASQNEEYAEIINVKHQYKDGKHTYAGELNLPTPCDLLQSDVVKDVTNAKNVEIKFTSVNKTEGACVEVLTARPFKVTFEGPKNITLTTTFNGKKIKFNIFEVPSTENLDTFEIYIKG